MEDIHLPELAPASIDLAASEGYRNELTRTNSDSSALTGENSKCVFDPNANATQCAEWTDLKHSSYLDSLEASFIKQLHSTMGLTGRSDQDTRDPNSSQQVLANTRKSSGQIMVLRDGRWQRITFRRFQPVLDNAVDSNVIQSNPWVRHFRCTGKGRMLAPVIMQQHRSPCSERMAPRGRRTFSPSFITSLEQLTVCHQYHQDSVGGITEFSDQNFADDDQEEKSSTSSKRLKMATADASLKDQIVPSGKFHKLQISPVNNSLEESKYAMSDEWLMDKLED